MNKTQSIDDFDIGTYIIATFAQVERLAKVVKRTPKNTFVIYVTKGGVPKVTSLYGRWERIASADDQFDYQDDLATIEHIHAHNYYKNKIEY